MRKLWLASTVPSPANVAGGVFVVGVVDLRKRGPRPPTSLKKK